MAKMSLNQTINITNNYNIVLLSNDMNINENMRQLFEMQSKSDLNYNSITNYTTNVFSRQYPSPSLSQQWMASSGGDGSRVPTLNHRFNSTSTLFGRNSNPITIQSIGGQNGCHFNSLFDRKWFNSRTHPWFGSKPQLPSISWFKTSNESPKQSLFSDAFDDNMEESKTKEVVIYDNKASNQCKSLFSHTIGSELVS